MTIISLYPFLKEVKQSEDIPIDIFFDRIRTGHYQDLILPLRAIQDKEQRTKAKERLPYVTISGRFSYRNTAGLIEHSGLIALDFDDLVNRDAFRDLMRNDPHVYACFISASGRGVCVVIKINPENHADSFRALEKYFYETYKEVATIDKGVKDIARARYVSYDPDLYHNEKAKKWTKLVKEPVHKKAPPKAIFVSSDFDDIICQIQIRGVDICPAYHDWVRCGYAIAEKFGESGRDAFHAISMNNPGYKYLQCEKLYSNCCKGSQSGLHANYATFVYLAKSCGIQVMSERTKIIAQAATFAAQGKRDQASAIKYLEGQGITAEQSKDIVNQVFEHGIEVREDAEIDLIQAWLRQEYVFRKNQVSRSIEKDNTEMDDTAFKDVYLLSKSIFPKVSYEDIFRIITSSFSIQYNPFVEFFNTYKELQHDPDILDRYFSCINSDKPTEYVCYYAKKWLVGAISNMLGGEVSPLMLVLTGPQGTGKTEFFRRMQPPGWEEKYYAESKMDAGKDDEILLCKKAFIFDDEMSGKSKKEDKHIKQILSKKYITVRAPYGRTSETLRRISTLCGSSNEMELLFDSTGNRRMIPIKVLSIDHAGIDKIDRIQLFIEAYRLYQSGWSFQLTQEEVQILNEQTTDFEASTLEGEALDRRYRTAGDPEIMTSGLPGFIKYMTAQEIHHDIELMAGKCSIIQVKRELRRRGWEAEQKKVNGVNLRRFKVFQVTIL